MIDKILTLTERWDFKKKIMAMFSILFCACIAGYMLLVAVYCIPTGGRMQRHMRNSAQVFKTEGTYPKLMAEGSGLDNFTDALMLLSAGHKKENGVFKDAINVRHVSIPKMDPAKTLVAVYQGKPQKIGAWSYGRYWHGYLTYLKPLLWLTDYQHIRSVLMFSQIGLFTLLLWKLFKQKPIFIIPATMSWLFLNPATTFMQLQYASMTTLMFLGMLGVLYLQKCKMTGYLWSVYFMLIGICASYFDLLTFPSITLGVPLLLWYCFDYGRYDLKNLMKQIVAMSASWTFGYGGFWASKWILGTLITGTNWIRNAMGAVANRSSGMWGKTDASFLRVVRLKFASVDSIFYIALAVLVIAIIWFCYKHYRKINMCHVVPLLFIGLYPLIWYLALRNHSLHGFTHRTLVTLPCAILTYWIIVFGEKENEEDSSTDSML